jgi:hypothetical protein
VMACTGAMSAASVVPSAFRAKEVAPRWSWCSRLSCRLSCPRLAASCSSPRRDLTAPRSAQSLRARASSWRARSARALVLEEVVPARRAASIERHARAVYGRSCPGVRVDRQACFPAADAAGVLSRAADVVAGGLGQARASSLTGFAVCRGPRARCLAASLRKKGLAEGLRRLEGHGAVVLGAPSRQARASCWRPPGSAVPRGSDARSEGPAGTAEVDAGEVVVLEKVSRWPSWRRVVVKCLETVMQRRPTSSRRTGR